MLTLEWSRFIQGALKDELPGVEQGTALTVGVFDGIHRGHRALIEGIIRKRPSLIPTVVTFKQSPKAALKKPGWAGDILSLNRKLAFFENMGVEAVILIDFSLNFSKMAGREFLDLLIRRANPLFMIIGAGFRCGYQMDTDAAQIKAFVKGTGILVEVADPVLEGLHPVSSSRIRSAIAEGDLSRAARLLGRNVEIDVTGMAVSFRSGGWFYHTASQNRIIPAPGRYSALLHGKDPGPGIKADVSVEKEGVFVPLPVKAEWIEFLKAGPYS
ncbi:MAG: FAD synthetase family protein [Treponema sp.]|jgi:riboflavin kinase/FMN adenylyltransferase|nr:FAD synthetase family protein [Treponema sp.]